MRMDCPRPAQGAVCIPQIAPFVNVYLPFGFQRFIHLTRSALHDVAKSFRIRAREEVLLDPVANMGDPSGDSSDAIE